MAAPAPAAGSVGPESLIVVKVFYNDSTRRFKIPLRDLGARVFPQKLRLLLGIPSDVNVIFERYSDSTANYIRLDSENVAVYKQLYRAAKAKLKLRIKAVVVDSPRVTTSVSTPPQRPVKETPTSQKSPTEYNSLYTVLNTPLPLSLIGSLPGGLPSTPDLSTVAGKPPASQPAVEDAGLSQSHQRESIPSSIGTAPPVISLNSSGKTYCVSCNNCARSIPGEHYHCSICDGGDYDLCMHCINAGISCPAEKHWLIKRFVQDGYVSSSTTESANNRNSQDKGKCGKKPSQQSFTEPVAKEVTDPLTVPSAHTVRREVCNACLQDYDEPRMVTCEDCECYRLCRRCFLTEKHGHHPAHKFSLIDDRRRSLKNQPGSRFHHAVVCDGCDKRVVGVRHKCLTCPDWDYCAECFSEAPQNHPGHRFVPIYEAISEPLRYYETHHGIFCDGPLCRNKPTYLSGVRYKCAICHDVDFCANCEALPTNRHNRTHPLIKFKTPVRGVTVSTIEDGLSEPAFAMGERSQEGISTGATAPIATATAPVESKDIQENKAEEERTKEYGTGETAKKTVPVLRENPLRIGWNTMYQACFLRDTIADGTHLPPNFVFQQTWTLYNVGPCAWPTDSVVCFTGGDSMLNIDTDQPSDLGSVMNAMKSSKLPAPVAPGQVADFTVTLKTGKNPGTAVSYWRLKHPNGQPFGALLWCHVEVLAESKFDNEKNDKPKGCTLAEEPRTENSSKAGSDMIFPLLDKESPATSNHEGVTRTSSEPAVSNASEKDLLDDVEDLTLEDGDTEGEFLTDEEYDVLDASDEEFFNAKQQK